MGGWSVFVSCCVWVVLLLALFGDSLASAPEFDPYKVLGVSRHASQAEIKKVYKRLAREWHPDKNKSPGAEDMFIKITKSYEILSNEERRANYDRFGQMDENQNLARAPQGFRHYHDSFYFDESFFHFPRTSRDFTDSKHLFHYNQYISEVLPDSFKRPYLIKITSEWCFTCIHIEPVWKDTVQELEPLGVGIGVVDIGYERQLANHLGAHRTPSILGLINGKVTFFHYAVVREHLRQFVESLLPQKLVEKVTDNSYLEFLNSWHEENKPRVLMFDVASNIPLLYKLTAFAYKDYVRFGYVDMGLTETSKVVQRFNINTYAPTMLLFKENTDKPADVIQAKGIKKQIIDEFVSNNRFLLVPRLVNQKLFDELCPVKQFHRRRKYEISPLTVALDVGGLASLSKLHHLTVFLIDRYCVLLVTGEVEQFVSVNEAFFDFASSNTKEVLRFAYVYQRQQQPLCDTLLKKEDTTPPQVILLERRSATGRVLYRTVTGGWNGSDNDKHRLLEQLELLQRDPSYLTHDAMLPELNNEFASMFLIQWINTAYDYLAQFYFDLLYSNWREMMPVLSLIFSALFILFGTVIIQAFSDAGEDKPAKQKATGSPKTAESSPEQESSSSRPPKKNFVEVTELTDITYTSNLVRLKPGHINVVLILTDASKQVLLRKFAKEVYSFSGSQTLHYSFLNVDKHSQWMDSLMESAPDARPSDRLDKEEEEEDSTSNKSDYTGHVLALNGHKKYFCLFRPVFTGEEAECSRWSDEDAATAGPSKASRSRSSSRQKATTLEIHHKLDRLGLWMERLMEGTLPRHYIPAWPGLDTITPQK
ncbi:dnaJ homolog subfamily C member 16-like isoform X1 [Sinocyclocheilus grahami]|uniref:dnaJ homolog subfamily C member 16-like isoform X1 n=1 Tax=Sinocyclocheilus grahami TaxID=75366 RepID=UPI0007ACB4AB|nr:PREDICTED: dnaJ homolog subfamily C member 16-like isoform X1 [Sinocyclocheilus grahami]XP_016114765.1 PREDICTED: dnaJ homolog subfamily C member 16-like isoform X1 [Sinocyclocheilus grahami]